LKLIFSHSERVLQKKFANVCFILKCNSMVLTLRFQRMPIFRLFALKKVRKPIVDFSKS